MLRAGKPFDWCTSTVTAGALMPSAARLKIFASTVPVRRCLLPVFVLLLRGQGRFELCEPQRKLLQLLAGAGEHPRLHVEFLAGDQVELAERRLQHRAEVALQVGEDLRIECHRRSPRAYWNLCHQYIRPGTRPKARW